MRHGLDTALTVLVLFCTAIVAWNLIRLNGRIGAANNASRAIPPRVDMVGKELGALKNNAKGVKKTVVLYLNPGCHFCEESMIFYRRLIRGARDRKDIEIVIATPLAEEIGRAYAHMSGLDVERVLMLSPATVGLPGTPTVLLLDHQAVVTGSWVGKLKPPQESEVEQALFSS